MQEAGKNPIFIKSPFFINLSAGFHPLSTLLSLGTGSSFCLFLLNAYVEVATVLQGDPTSSVEVKPWVGSWPRQG